MDISHTKKLLASILAISLMLSSSVMYGASSSANTNTEFSPDHMYKKQSKQHHRSFPIIEEAASILAISANHITQSLKDGKSLVDLAKEKGMGEADFTNKLLEIRLKQLDASVATGIITKEKAVQMKAKMQEHISFMVNSKNLLQMKGQKHGKQLRQDTKQMLSPKKLAVIIGISEDKLIEQLKSGKSIVEIAEAQGINKQQLMTKIKEQLTPFLDKAVEHKGKYEQTPITKPNTSS